MKNLSVKIALFVTIVASLFGAKKPHFVNEMKLDNLYPTTAFVTELDYENDLVYITDTNGHCWSFYGTEDWQIDDVCSCIMNNKGTEKVFDDEILKVRYSGHFTRSEN